MSWIARRADDIADARSYQSLGPRAVERARSPQRSRQGMAIATWTPTTSIGFRPIPRTSKRRPREARLALLDPTRAVAVLGVVGVSMRVGRPSHSGVRLGCISCRPNAGSADPPASARGLAYGHQAIAPGGERHDAHVAFLDWAGRYDAVVAEMRSRALHEPGSRHCPARFSGWKAIVPSPSS